MGDRERRLGFWFSEATVHELYSSSEWPPQVQSSLTTHLISKVTIHPLPPFQPPLKSFPALPDDPETVALKRTYLSFLTNQQVTDICITLDLYAPTHVRNTIWPHDLKATIATLLANQTKPAPSEKSSSEDQSKPTDGLDQTANGHEPPPMASLGQPPPQKPQSGAQETPQPSEPHPQPHPPPPPPPSVQYYPYPSPQVPPYPHAPYYGHGQHHPPSMPGFLPPPMPYSTMYTRPPVTRPDGSTEDLPSYEEMIVNALADHPDPEGAPPKDLFAWMAARYPLQTNFRPSASQALQKAFKRGRLEKGQGGKYRLNASWEGGSVGLFCTDVNNSFIVANVNWIDFAQNHETSVNTPGRRPSSTPAPSVYADSSSSSWAIQLPTLRLSWAAAEARTGGYEPGCACASNSD